MTTGLLVAAMDGAVRALSADGPSLSGMARAGLLAAMAAALAASFAARRTPAQRDDAAQGLDVLSSSFPADPAFVVGFDGSLSSANHASRQLLGYSEAELRGKPFADLVHPDDRDRTRAEIALLQAGRTSTSFDNRCVCRDGSHRWLHWAATAEPARRRFHAVARDVTEPRRAEAFQAAQRRVLEQLATGTGLRDVLTGLTLSIEQLVPGMRCSILLLDDAGHLRTCAAPGLPEGYNTAIDGVSIGPSVGSCGTAAYTGRRVIASDISTDPRWAPWRDAALSFGLQACWSQPITTGGGRVLGTFAMYYGEPREPAGWDIEIIEGAAHVAGIAIERDRAESELAQARDRALEVARLKTEFLANMSHEIRTPINVIFGMTDIALDTDLTPEQRETIDAVRSSATSLLDIINDVLDFAKIEAGKLELETVPFAPREMLDEGLKPLALRARARALSLEWRVSPEVPEVVVSDPARLRQILVNLIGNSIKFTEVGRLLCAVDLAERGPDWVLLHFAVSDTGIGIPPDKHKEIFGAFVQGDGSTTRRFGGTGLGLAICARLVELVGGRIWVESELGRGSTFHFTARAGHATASLRPEPPRLAVEAEPRHGQPSAS